MDKETTNDRKEGEGTINICAGNFVRDNFDIVDSFRRTFDELSDVEEDEGGAATDLFYNFVSTESVDALATPPTHHDVGGKDSKQDSGVVDNESEAYYSGNTKSGAVVAPHNAATIFRYNRSATMSVFSAAAALPTDDAASPFDEIVASFVPPHAAAAEEEEAQSLNNKVDDKILVAEKAVPSLHLAATCSSSFESSTDSNDEEIALEDKLPIDEDKEEEDKRRIPRSILFWIVISLVCLLFLGLVPVFLAIAKKNKINDEQGAMMTGSVFQGSPGSPEKQDIDDQQMSGPVVSVQPEEAKVPTAEPTLTPSESNGPSDVPSIAPSASSSPSNMPSRVPSGYPTASPFKLFNYGESLYTNYELGIQLSEGLNAKLIAQKNSRVKYADGSESTLKFHEWLDGAGVAPLPDGGYVYISNSEDDAGKGGVFGLYFDKDGGITNYKALLTGTTWNCGGGKGGSLKM
jgi:hypothetical protein